MPVEPGGKAGRPSRFMKVEEVAPLFLKSPKTIYRWAKDPRKLGTAAVRDPGGGVLFERARIEQLIELMVKGLL